MLANGAAVAAWSRRQNATTVATMEAEAYAAMLAVRIVLAVRRTSEFMLSYKLPPTIIYEDNESLITALKSRDLSARTRHTRVNLGFIMDAVDAEEVVFEFVTSGDQVADAATQAEDPTRFIRNRDRMLGNTVTV